MLKYVLFDLDGTILDFNKGEEDAFIKSISKFNNINLTKFDIKKFSEINEYYFNEYKNGKMDRPTFHFNRFNEIAKYLNIDIDPYLCNKEYVELLKYEEQMFDDVLDTLNYLKDKYKLFIASNGMGDVQAKRIELAGIDKYFIKSYISENIGYQKPDLEFFNYIFNDINDYNKDNYVIIGDRIDSDILGGINSNIHTIFVNRNNVSSDIKLEYEIKSLDEIKNIL